MCSALLSPEYFEAIVKHAIICNISYMSLTIAHQWRLHALPDSDTHHTTCLFLGCRDQLVLGHSSHYLEGNNEAAPC